MPNLKVSITAQTRVSARWPVLWQEVELLQMVDVLIPTGTAGGLGIYSEGEEVVVYKKQTA